MSDANAVCCGEYITVQIPIDGYDVSVKIGVGAICREISKADKTPTEEYRMEGPNNRALSKYAQVRAEPTAEKWSELANAE